MTAEPDIAPLDHGPRAADAVERPVPVLLMVRELGIGGCEADLTKIAKGLDRRRFAPHVGCFRPEGLRLAEIRAAGVPILHLPVRGLRSPTWASGAWSLARYIRRHRIRVVHSFDSPMDIFAIPVAWACRTSAIVKSHLWYRHMVGHHRIMAMTDRMADAIIVNSNAVRRDLAANWDVPDDRMSLCYNGIETSIFNPGTTDLRSAPQREIVIGAVCALRPEKRLDTLIAAFAALDRRAWPVKLLIVGSGGMLESLRAQARDLGLMDVVRFEPTSSRVADWMRQIDIFVLSSESESFPNALLEAMACGCCPIASSVGGVPELITDGQNGLLCTPNDVDQFSAALRRVVADAPLRDRLRLAAARAARDEFSAERYVDCTTALYSRLLADAG